MFLQIVGFFNQPCGKILLEEFQKIILIEVTFKRTETCSIEKQLFKDIDYALSHENRKKQIRKEIEKFKRIEDWSITNSRLCLLSNSLIFLGTLKTLENQ